MTSNKKKNHLFTTFTAWRVYIPDYDIHNTFKSGLIINVCIVCLINYGNITEKLLVSFDIYFTFLNFFYEFGRFSIVFFLNVACW